MTWSYDGEGACARISKVTVDRRKWHGLMMGRVLVRGLVR